MKIAIIGLGFVGLSLTGVLYSKLKNILGIDLDS
jgi:UDP-N-acetyl-D-mannosaminuronate dehydrogenase